jgi:3-oxoacyl-(acyl-carrier-protein) synthase
MYQSGEDARTTLKERVFSRPFKNFGRLDEVSRTTASAVGLALRDAGLECSPERKQDIGIVGTNALGSLGADADYFRDYLDSGRTLSRGNLFIYTLPSSAVGEAAIHFGFLGPALYASGGGGLLTAFDAACEMIDSGQAAVMLAGEADRGEALFFVIDGNDSAGTEYVCGLDEARALADARGAALAEDFIRMAAGKR